jgi:hypothetical protein
MRLNYYDGIRDVQYVTVIKLLDDGTSCMIDAIRANKNDNVEAKRVAIKLRSSGKCLYPPRLD